MCEFAINDREQESTKASPFFLNYGQHPWSASDLFTQPSQTASSISQNWLHQQRTALKCARDCVHATQVRQTAQADTKRCCESFKVGAQVMVHRDFLKTPESRQQSCNKLKQMWVGPFCVDKVVSVKAYKLQLPPGSRAHPAFNVSALKIYKPNTIPSKTQPPPMITDLKGHTRYRVEAVLKGISHQILLSEMSLPRVEVLIEKLLPKILGRLGKENPSKRQCKVAFVQRKCAVTSTVSVQFLYASYN